MISGLVSGAISAISSVVSTIGGALAGVASNLLKLAGPLLGQVSTVIKVVGILLNILKPNEEVEELGAKALEAEQKAEDFNSNAEYIDYLRKDIKLDKEKFEKANDVEKIARTAVGASIVTKGIEENKGFEIPTMFWVKVAEQALKAKEINALIDAFKGDKLGTFIDYSDGKLSYKDEVKTGDKLAEIYKGLEPELSKEEIEEKVMKLEVEKI